jgi:hypothetical protein
MQATNHNEGPVLQVDEAEGDVSPEDLRDDVTGRPFRCAKHHGRSQDDSPDGLQNRELVEHDECDLKEVQLQHLVS